MNKQNKTLLIHNDTQNDKVTAIVVEEKDVLQKTKEFLKNIATPSNSSPLGIILSSEDNKNSYAVAYEQENFIIVAQNGTQKSAKLYGNWDEALLNAQKILCKDICPEKKVKIAITQHINEK